MIAKRPVGVALLSNCRQELLFIFLHGCQLLAWGRTANGQRSGQEQVARADSSHDSTPFESFTRQASSLLHCYFIPRVASTASATPVETLLVLLNDHMLNITSTIMMPHSANTPATTVRLMTLNSEYGCSAVGTCT